jgi:D-alanyl-D-alanine carboxypeptidase/D-alanyl-D-alanine-endopeptidase (penicillin-binding protein 4)
LKEANQKNTGKQMKPNHKNCRIQKSFTRALFPCLAFLFFLSSCSVSKRIDKVAKEDILDNTQLKSAHVGICIYDPSTKKYLYNHNADKYFTPASNTKIITCYAAMKYLGDSLTGMKYKRDGNNLFWMATGDPTLMHPDFITQPVISFLKSFDSTTTIFLDDSNFQDKAWGTGWSWDDYSDDYMAERSAIPVYENVVEFEGSGNMWTSSPSIKASNIIDSGGGAYLSNIDRSLAANSFTLYFSGKTPKKIQVPFCTNKGETNIQLLRDLIKAKIVKANSSNKISAIEYSTIHSQPTDSLLKIMMHRSDNFYAEQSLLMISNKLLGVMNDEKIIDTLLKTDYKEMPQIPAWVDGSGLSRYNLFTPQDLVFILDKIRNEFSWNRITTIFATGGKGTLEIAYQNLQNKIFAKTGTLSNNAALSGYLITDKGKTLIFSILVANHLSSGSNIRSSISKFLCTVKEKF